MSYEVITNIDQKTLSFEVFEAQKRLGCWCYVQLEIFL